jgi:hypothetical protein
LKRNLRRLAFLILALTFSCAAQQAEPDPEEVRAMVPALVPVAEKACADMTSRKDLSAHELDRAAVQALSDMDRMDQDHDLGAIRVRLARLVDEVGDIDSFPLLRLHFLLGYLAGEDGNIKQQAYHRAFALALTRVMEKDGIGQTEAMAIHPCLIANEYDWLRFRAGIEQPGTQALQSSSGRHYDVITSRAPDGQEAAVYFDVSEMMEQAQRRFQTVPDGKK